MTSDSDTPNSDLPAKDAKKRSGRPSSGKSRGEALKLYDHNYRDRLLSEGKVEIKAFILTSTKSDMASIKQMLGLPPKCAVGEVIDAMVQHFKNNL